MSLISLASKPRQQMRIHEPIPIQYSSLLLKKSIGKLPPFFLLHIFSYLGCAAWFLFPASYPFRK